MRRGGGGDGDGTIRQVRGKGGKGGREGEGGREGREKGRNTTRKGMVSGVVCRVFDGLLLGWSMVIIIIILTRKF